MFFVAEFVTMRGWECFDPLRILTHCDRTEDISVSIPTTTMRSDGGIDHADMMVSSDHFVEAFDSDAADYVDHILAEAVRLAASDLFITFREDAVEIAFRVMGFIRSLGKINRELGARLMSHLKATADMDVTRSFTPQDGRTYVRLRSGEGMDIRLSIVPTLYGEDMALRILDRNRLLNLDDIGFHPTNFNRLHSIINRPSGLILVAGPTGMGKTTTLYAALKHLNDGTRKIHTIEDPIEFALDGIHQSQVNQRRGVDFPDLLRAILRQSPDIIMVGEIRDTVTADIVIRAANSGQLVFATSHARSTVEACEAMLVLGVQPQFLASGLLGIVTQRLIRKLCPHCKIPLMPGEFSDICPNAGEPSTSEPNTDEQIYTPVGCLECNTTGYQGRIAVGEVLRVTREIERMIRSGESMYKIHQKAVEEGMIDLRTDAQQKLDAGITSPDEILRAIPGNFAETF
jgi:type IV pilus assembly protein PilB